MIDTTKGLGLVLFYILSLTWGLLQTIIGMLVFLFFFIFMHRKTHYAFVAGRIAIVTDGSFGGASLGLFYVISKHYSTQTHAHELGHSLQNILWGPLFPFVIGIPSFTRALFWDVISNKHKARTGLVLQYDDAWFEGQATQLGYKYFYNKIANKVALIRTSKN